MELSEEVKNLRGTRIVAKVKLHNYRFPRSGHQSGDYAIFNLDVIRVVEGKIPSELSKNAKGVARYLITATGNIPKLDPEEEYVFQGVLVVDKQWGPQYETEEIRLDYDLTQESDQRDFFSYFMTPKQIDTLFSQTQNPIDFLEKKDIESLTKIKGIGPATAARMCSKYLECKDNGRAYVALKGLDLSKRVIDRLIANYGSADIVVGKIEENPYILIKEIKGIGWKKADDLAKRQGIPNNCKERVLAYAQYYLEEQAESNGNSWVSYNDLVTNVKAECEPIEKDTVSSWVQEVMCGIKMFNEYYGSHIVDGKTYSDIFPGEEEPLLFYDENNNRIGLFKLRVLEKDISSHLFRLKEASSSFTYEKDVCEKIIKECEEEQGYEYTDEQTQAIWNILDNNVSILTGGGGTGKSSTLIPLIRIFKHYKLFVEQCALSGRASSLLSEITDIEGKTIHRLLRYIPDKEGFMFTARNNLPSDVIILDETSMVGGELYYCLVSAIKTGAKFIMLGDTHQLESIGLANILKDCISSGYINTNILTKIHRQAAMSGIISQSVAVSNGTTLMASNFSGEEIRGTLKDFKLIATQDPSLIPHYIIEEFKRLYFLKKISVDDIQVIVPMRSRGQISCRALNEQIQNIVNPNEYKNVATINCFDGGQRYTVTFKPNDKVIVIKNNYHADGLDGSEKQIFNGNIGTVKDISGDTMIVSINDVGDIIFDKEQWNSLQLAYAITVHKKQGDSVPYAILGLDYSAYALLSKELLYTAITRARRFCTLVTQPKAANLACRTSRVKTKQTWLKDDLLQFLIEKEV